MHFRLEDVIMIFDNLEYKSVFSKYIIKYLEEQRDINHNVFYLKYILRDFDLYLYRNYKNEMNGITKELITGWLVKKDTEKYSTRKHRASIIKNFCLFLTNYIDNVWIVNTKLYYKGGSMSRSCIKCDGISKRKK